MENCMQRLDGIWHIAVDPENCGRRDYIKKGYPLSKKPVRIPAAIQEAYPYYDGVAWYFLTFDSFLSERAGARYLLKFGAVDYLCEVWLNERYLGLHEDGEEPFEFDVTGILAPGGNYLAVRVLSPAEEAVDGVVLNETPHRNKANRDFWPGKSINCGGIMQPVELSRVPIVSIGGTYVHGDAYTGRAEIEVTAINRAEAPVPADIAVRIFERGAGRLKTEFSLAATLPAGESAHRLSGVVRDHMLWSTDHPFLYDVLISLYPKSGTEKGIASERTARMGFRDFRVKEGFFHLNGKRIFLKCSHTGNNMPVGFVTSRDPGMIRKDLLYAKACGFNAIRFIAGMALPEQLELCDEIGLMVYEECYAAWCLQDSPRMAERFDKAVSSMVRRDRSHPSVAIWGLLNETEDGPVFRHAVDFLPRLRALDATRLVLLGSGRWDCRPGTGSLCNPGGMNWECAWGSEREGSGGVTKVRWGTPVAPYAEGMGDVHIYPALPQMPEVNDFLRSVGRDTKPVFISEYGHGSQNNVIQEYLKFEENHEPADGEDASCYREMAQSFLTEWERLGMDGACSFAEDFLIGSMRAHCRLRQINFDSVRANPMICGYNLTGLLDHGLTGEGLWTYWRILKPGIADALAEGWAPLRWCMFAERYHGYAGRPLRIEAVLANEDVLRPGGYPARFRIKGPGGIVWEGERTVEIPGRGYGGMPPLAVPALDERVVLHEPGEYEFAASLKSGGSPAGGRRRIVISDPRGAGDVNACITTAGCHAELCEWMRGCGIQCIPYGRNSQVRRLILVGDSASENDVKEFINLAERGCTVVFLSPSVLMPGGDVPTLLPFEQKGKYVKYNNWLYHVDGITRRHPVFEGLEAGGIMEADYFDTLFPASFFEGIRPPDNTLCAVFGVGQPRPGGTVAGVALGDYRWGNGRIVLNTLDILRSVASNPAADRLLVNIVKYYQ